MHRTILPALLSAACGGPMMGSWSGTCALVAGDRTQSLDIVLDVDEDHGRAFSGTADIDSHDFDYALDGDATDTRITFELLGQMPGESDGPEAHLAFDGARDGDALDGTGEYYTVVVSNGNTGESDHFLGDCAFEAY